LAGVIRWNQPGDGFAALGDEKAFEIEMIPLGHSFTSR
jgi:hypothetical protein